MAFTRTKSLLAATSIIALLTGCSDFADTLESYGEAGKIPESHRFGEATDWNTGIHEGRYVFDMAKRFHETVPDTVTFAFNSAVLDEAAMAVLRRQASFISQFPEVRWKVFGHTDLVGSDAYNKQLGLRRAQAVVAYLTSQGVSRKRLEAVVSYGETRPLIATPDQEQRNRRTVTEVSGFVQDAPLIHERKYLEVIFRDYIESAREMPPTDDAGVATIANAAGGGGG